MSNRRDFFTKISALIGLGFASKSLGKLSDTQIAAAWEDPAYRANLTDAQWEKLPGNPAGDISSAEFSGDLAQASGNSCSGNGCSGNGCSGNGCSGNGCSGNGCSGNGCSGNSCSGNSCGG